MVVEVIAITFTVIVQEPFAGIVPPLSVILLVVTVVDPPQVLDAELVT